MILLNQCFATMLLAGMLTLTGATGSSSSAVPVNTAETMALPPLFRCAAQNGSSLVKCTVERKKTTYFFTTKSSAAGRYELRIEAVIKGAATLVYSGTISTIDNRSKSNEYVVQIQLSKKQGYRWQPIPGDALKATYNLKDNSIAFAAEGNMKNYLDTSHGMTSDQVKKGVTPPKFDQDNVVKAVAAYFILEYTKALDMPKK